MDRPEGPRYRGVCWHKRRNKWRVKIWTQGKDFSLGYFTDPQRAARVYDAAAVMVHGPDAVLNFDGDPPSDMTTAEIKRLLAQKGIHFAREK